MGASVDECLLGQVGEKTRAERLRSDVHHSAGQIQAFLGKNPYQVVNEPIMKAAPVLADIQKLVQVEKKNLARLRSDDITEQFFAGDGGVIL